jgi:hypothetical protein
MMDDALPVFVSYEAVAALTRVLRPAIPLGDGVYAVTEYAAQIPHPLGESIAVGVRIRAQPKKQRVTATDAGILAVAVPLGNRLVGMVPEET